MKLSLILITTCCFCVFMGACTKKKYKTDTAKLIEAGKWQVVAETATLNYNGKDTTINLYADIKDCEKDDFVTFSKNGKSTKDEGGNVCSGKSQTATIKWELRNNDTQIYLEDDNPDTYELEVNSSQMKLKITKPNSSGTLVTYLHTYNNIK